ncbi:MAG: beta-ketoacyl reductase [Caldilineaceae bacterium]
MLFLDGLMHYRHANGMKSLSINWGAWADIGLAATLSFQKQGIASMKPTQGGEVLVELVHRIGTESRAQILVQPTNWRQYFSQVGKVHPFYEQLAQEASSQPASSYQPQLTQINLRQEMDSLAPPKRKVRLMAYLEEIARGVLGLAPHQELHSQLGLINMGMDSLMAVEIRNRLNRSLQIDIAITDLLGELTLEQLCQRVEEQIEEQTAKQLVTEHFLRGEIVEAAADSGLQGNQPQTRIKVEI